MRLALLLLLVLAACGRPLTDAERAFMADLQGETFDPAPVRLVENPLIGLTTRTYPVRPRSTCRERIMPPPERDTFTSRTAGVVLFNTVHTRPDFVIPDYARTDEGQMNLVAAMYFAHEMTHVWQWQNRALTGYHPLRALGEHVPDADPYLFDPDPSIGFLDFAYEQQASLVEEYVCCRALDPQGGRTARLEGLLSRVMDLTPIAAQSDRPEVLLPWAGVEPRGICS